MYRNGNCYDDIDAVIYQIYVDYQIHEFPINVQNLCQKLGVELIPYSTYSDRERMLLMKKSQYAFFVRGCNEIAPRIYYNDQFPSQGAIRLSILHEIKHYVFEDEGDEEDDLADYFARHFLCPTVLLLLKGIYTPERIAEFCGVSNEAANFASMNVKKRWDKYGYKVFPWEYRFIEEQNPMYLSLKQIQPYQNGDMIACFCR